MASERVPEGNSAEIPTYRRFRNVANAQVDVITYHRDWFWSIRRF